MVVVAELIGRWNKKTRWMERRENLQWKNMTNLKDKFPSHVDLVSLPVRRHASFRSDLAWSSLRSLNPEGRRNSARRTSVRLYSSSEENEKSGHIESKGENEDRKGERERKYMFSIGLLSLINAFTQRGEHKMYFSLRLEGKNLQRSSRWKRGEKSASSCCCCCCC